MSWIPVDAPPKLDKWGFSEKVLISALDTDWEESEAKYFPQHSVSTAFLMKLTSGTLVWMKDWDDLVETDGELVTHWQPLPEPAGS